MAGVEDGAVIVKDLFDLIHKYQVPTPPEDLAVYQVQKFPDLFRSWKKSVLDKFEELLLISIPSIIIWLHSMPGRSQAEYKESFPLFSLTESSSRGEQTAYCSRQRDQQQRAVRPQVLHATGQRHCRTGQRSQGDQE